MVEDTSLEGVTSLDLPHLSIDRLGQIGYIVGCRGALYTVSYPPYIFHFF